VTDPWEAQREALGAFIREQRKRANLSLRQLAELTSLSNPYLSQVERGLHQPSVRVLKALSGALNVSAETLLAQAGLIDAMVPADAKDEIPEPAAGERTIPGTEAAILADPRLGQEQKAALIAVYRSMLGPQLGAAPNGSAPDSTSQDGASQDGTSQDSTSQDG
jgi:transcriptional regulator with XRE-family HTH domain